MAGPCDDCTRECRNGCAYVRPDEQPYFQAFRLAHRIGGDDWDTWDFMRWMRCQWDAYGKEHGVYDHQRLLHREQFQAWLWSRVGHPEAA